MTVPQGGRQILLHGMAMVLVGLIWGLLISGTPHPRLALGAHIQFVTNGLLFIVMASLLLSLPHRVGPRSIVVMVIAAWLTWGMAISEVGNSWWGTTRMLPISAAQAGVSGGESWQESVVSLAHVSAGLGLIAAWAVLLLGFFRAAPGGDAEQG
ncbi:MAG: hypothetical protein ACKO0M_18080 [Cyanobium sp.]